MPFVWYYAEQVVTTPAGTAIATPQQTTVPLQDSWVNRIKIRWPEGHNGLTGIYVTKSGLPIIPFGSPPTFITANDDEEWFDVGDEVQDGLVVVTYNIGIYPHGHYLRIESVPIGQWLASGPETPNFTAMEGLSSS
ncbi:MAG TPA: hypothetical protein VGG32_08490 [Thermoplasmata archaeon]|jgi:hypothetical protein